jgi:hypothetical protein
MRKLLSLSVACLLAGCLDTTSPKDAVVVTGVASTASIRAEQPVSITLTIHNRGDEAIQLAIDECIPPYEILNARGEVVGPGPRVCTLALYAPTVVPPGSSTTYTTTWAGEALSGDPSVTRPFLGPGDYTIRPRVRVDAEGGGFVYGNSIPISVIP